MLLIESIAKMNFTTLKTFKKKSPVLEQLLLGYLAAGVLGRDQNTYQPGEASNLITVCAVLKGE